MTQIGESVGVPEFANDTHNKNTCPWHKEGDKNKKKMKPTNPDEDTPAMAPNDGGELGRNMKSAKDKPPKADTVSITYKEGEQLKWKAGQKTKTVQVYKESRSEEEYDLQYAPHHLIPGNESLKGSAVVPFLGDADTIEEFAKGKSSVIKEGFSTGYDVNCAENGVWLPSPYALSNANSWPSEPGVKVIKKRLGARSADQTEDFKTAYVAASIEESPGRQFHMRHKEYSDKVGEILEAIGARLKAMARSECPIAADSKSGGKFDPPMGLPGRLHVLSGNLRRLTIGGVWRDPMYTDALTKEYAEDNLKKSKRKGKILKVV